ncbi:DUF202 domain-containing protein [Nocardioides jensenii]|uniref:DUF202 domain-containing protein n=1 Tax=Nocardioides jensenii TaxID=1843 RepID=UPI001FDF6B51|nr:DUF202 domain-containing protein [Nocardioides jensenii]
MRDTGISNERTALAWQRTALSLVAGAAVVARLGVDKAGPVLVVLVGLAAVLGLWIFVESSGRYRHSAGSSVRVRGRGGRAALALTVATVLIGAGELLLVLR